MLIESLGRLPEDIILSLGADLLPLDESATGDDENLTSEPEQALAPQNVDLRLIGSSAKDDLTGGIGNDQIAGLARKDTLSGGAGNDIIIGGRGKDTITGDDGDDTLLGAQGTDFMFGGIGADQMLGGFGADSMEGGEGDDRLSGNQGRDFINGGEGDDLLMGGLGGDTFIFEGDFGNDVVLDFDPDRDILDIPGPVGIAYEIIDQGTLLTVVGGEANGTILLFDYIEGEVIPDPPLF